MCRHYHVFFLCNFARQKQNTRRESKECNFSNEIHFLSTFTYKETNFMKFPSLVDISEDIWHGYYGSTEGHDPISCLIDQIWDQCACVYIVVCVCAQCAWRQGCIKVPLALGYDFPWALPNLCKHHHVSTLTTSNLHEHQPSWFRWSTASTTMHAK